jgi:hypothetical protein
MRRKGGGGYNHLVFCLSFPTFAPMTIPFRHTRDKEVFERTKKSEQIIQKKDPKKIWVYCRIQALPSGGEDRPKEKKK